MADLRQHMAARARQETIPEFEAPSYWTSIIANDDAVAYCKRNHVWEAYRLGLVDLRYDPREHRAVFCLHHQGRVVDAAGRALAKGVKPKWKQFGRSGLPFVAGKGPVGVIVEDSASACAVAPCAMGIAQWGTDLRAPTVKLLKGLDTVLIALDPDATTKALALSRSLAFFVKTRVIRLPDDLKYFEPSDIRRILGLDEVP